MLQLSSIPSRLLLLLLASALAAFAAEPAAAPAHITTPAASTPVEVHGWPFPIVTATVPIVLRDGPPGADDYVDEHAYIIARRQATGLTPVSPAELKPVGLAFSGGGLRSATLNLGVLQGLQYEHKLASVDYLSCVSGGAYVASWFVAHYRRPNDRSDGFPAPVDGDDYSENLDQLLAVRRGLGEGGGQLSPADLGDYRAMKRLYDHRGFLAGRFGESYLWRLPFWLIRYPAYVVLDLTLHFQLTRGKSNWTHPYYIYRRAIISTYLPETDAGHRMNLLNLQPDGTRSPYLIIDGAMHNGQKGTFGDARNRHFEFTAKLVGSHETGFMETKNFDLPIKETVLHPTHLRDLRLRSDDRPLDTPDHARILCADIPPLSLATPISATVQDRPWSILPKTRPFAVANAVAASGAAADARAWPDHPAYAFVFDALNLNLRYHTRNFSQSLSRPEDMLADRWREMTTDRFSPQIDSNSLTISDGAHNDNLGVIALVRRQADPILVSDMTSDPDYTFSSLRKTHDAVRREFCPVCHQPDCRLNWTWVGRKPYPDACNADETAAYACAYPNTYYRLASRPEWKGFKSTAAYRAGSYAARSYDHPVFVGNIDSTCGRYHAHVVYVKGSYHESFTVAPPTDPDLFLAASVKQYAESFHAAETFPQLGTEVLGFNADRYNAYRQIGFYLGRRLAREAFGIPPRPVAPPDSSPAPLAPAVSPVHSAPR